jgi:hypothetical protein
VTNSSRTPPPPPAGVKSKKAIRRNLDNASYINQLKKEPQGRHLSIVKRDLLAEGIKPNIYSNDDYLNAEIKNALLDIERLESKYQLIAPVREALRTALKTIRQYPVHTVDNSELKIN